MWWKENKTEWKKSAVRFLFYLKYVGGWQHLWMNETGFIPLSTFFYLSILPPCGQQLVMMTPVPSSIKNLKKKNNKKHSTHWSLLYSSNFKIYWDWLAFANNSQANSSTKHDVRKRLGRPVGQPQHQNRRLMVDCKNVLWSVLSTEKYLHKST